MNKNNTNTKKSTFSDKTSIFIASLMIVIMILLSTLIYHAYNEKTYHETYKKNNIITRLQKNTTTYMIKNMIDFLKNKSQLDTTYFNPDEISHMYDVKALFNKTIHAILIMSLIVTAISLAHLKNIKKYYYDVSKMQFCMMVMLLFIAAISYLAVGFDSLFRVFHKIFFSGNYAFNPSISDMKALLPDSLFIDMSISIIVSSMMMSFIIFMVSKIIKNLDSLKETSLKNK